MEGACSSSSSSPFKDAEMEAQTPLTAVAEAFEELGRSWDCRSEELQVEPFVFACSHVAELFGCLGFAFKFAQIEYVSKVNGLLEASKLFDNLSNILDNDVKNDVVRKPGSHSRNLRRVRLGLDLLRTMFEQFLSSEEISPKEAASSAYAQVCAPFHTWAIRTAVGAGMCTLPTRDHLLLKLGDTG
ncbi:hypothetical protein KSP39_PZI010154 [Platanthera zijinensis]|uniref:Glycolipid transfer protein domain-containing protein n=1 Tax=Platanthera zijinensis TaxID=2320716 RepID=A0AAP0G6P6_9ASPA